MKIDVTPYAALPIPVDRQQKIVNAINARLAIHPRHSFCFIGSPGVGKTYLMKKIQDAALASRTAYHKPLVSQIVTLSDWHDANLQASREGRTSPGFISAGYIRQIAGENTRSKAYGSMFSSALHYFIDEFDSAHRERLHERQHAKLYQCRVRKHVQTVWRPRNRLCPTGSGDG